MLDFADFVVDEKMSKKLTLREWLMPKSSLKKWWVLFLDSESDRQTDESSPPWCGQKNQRLKDLLQGQNGWKNSSNVFECIIKDINCCFLISEYFC